MRKELNEIGPERTELDKLTDRIVDAFFAVHKSFGPGLNERIYEACLVKELSLMGIPWERQVRYPIVYKGEKLKEFCVIDLIVDKRVIVELKSVTEFIPIHQAQLLTYLKLTDLKAATSSTSIRN